VERTECLPISNLDTNRDVNIFRSKRISLSEIATAIMLLDEKKLTSVIDMDGVFCEYGRRDNHKDNVSNFLGLGRIIANSEKVVFNSGRISFDENGALWGLLKPILDGTSISRCPVMTRSSMERLKTFSERINPDCEIIFNIGFKKMIGTDDLIFNISKETLKQNKKMVFIGSSLFDRKIVNRIFKEVENQELDIKNIHSFNTGHWFV
jgi:hypothetical protein